MHRNEYSAGFFAALDAVEAWLGGLGCKALDSRYVLDGLRRLGPGMASDAAAARDLARKAVVEGGRRWLD